VILAGLAQGLDRALQCGSVITVSEVFNPHGPTLLSPLAAAIVAPDVDKRRGTSSLVPVKNVAAKADLFRTSRAAVVDLESVPFSQIAEQLGWNWGIVRVVFEEAKETLPTSPDRWTDHLGQQSRRAMAMEVFQRPSRLRTLKPIRARAEKAIMNLARTLAALEFGEAAPTRRKRVSRGRDILIFGGTFDPPHTAHIELPFLVAPRIGCERVIFVPAKVNPLKQDTPPTSAEHRVAMLKLALADHPEARISKCELKRSGPSFMIDTLRYLQKKLEGEGAKTPRLRLLIGSDQALQFTQWHDWKKILDLATPAIMMRPPFTRAVFSRALAEAGCTAALARSFVSWTVDLPQRHANSTTIRSAVAEGTEVSDLAPSVAEYIEAHRLYRARERAHD
jgi:nicotinate-nucleotide adenylyltransferase